MIFVVILCGIGSFIIVSLIHECSKAYTNECHRLYADCNNQVGGYMCQCKEGFYGDGLSCSGMLVTLKAYNV